VYLHGLVNDAQGKKMSKSKGNVISPLDLTGKYGTDALRMSLVVGNTPGTDLAMREEKVKGYKHFANKLWNISRFILENTADLDTSMPVPSLMPEDEALKTELDALAADITSDIEEYRIYLAAEKIYHFVWHRLADEVIELSKPILAGEDDAAKVSRQYTLRHLLTTALKLLHPLMPFITEEIWQHMPENVAAYPSLMIAKWPA
jgi:valyl-tRNA synthetase